MCIRTDLSRDPGVYSGRAGLCREIRGINTTLQQVYVLNPAFTFIDGAIRVLSFITKGFAAECKSLHPLTEPGWMHLSIYSLHNQKKYPVCY